MTKYLIMVLAGVLLTLGIYTSRAQETVQSGWPIEQHCVGEPTKPPEGWKWEGRIFVQGIEGIRVLDADLASPYFVLFDSPFIYAAALSPDGKWYAVPTGYQGYETMLDNSFVVEGIKVVSTDTSRKIHSVPWQYHGRGMFRAYSVPGITWTDSEHLLYTDGYDSGDVFNLNPFDGTSSKMSEKISAANAILSPDSERAVQYNALSVVSDDAPQFNVYRMPDGNLIASIIYRPESIYGGITWLPDSSAFTVITQRPDMNGQGTVSQLILFGRDGNSLDHIFVGRASESIENVNLSRDGHYLAFTYEDGNLYIVNLKEHQVVDTCQAVKGEYQFNRAAWSPEGYQLAFTSNGNVGVLNVDTGAFYTIASKMGEVVAWGQK